MRSDRFDSAIRRGVGAIGGHLEPGEVADHGIDELRLRTFAIEILESEGDRGPPRASVEPA